MSDPYKKISVNGVLIYKHKHIVEQSIGRKLIPGECVHHKDFNTRNNHIDNLQIMDNQSHSKLHAAIRLEKYKNNPLRHTQKSKLIMSKHAQGEGNSNSKMTDDLVRKIRNSNEPTYLIAATVGLARPTITLARNGYRWKHIEMPQVKSGYTFLGVGSDWVKEKTAKDAEVTQPLNQETEPELHVLP